MQHKDVSMFLLLSRNRTLQRVCSYQSINAHPTTPFLPGASKGNNARLHMQKDPLQSGSFIGPNILDEIVEEKGNIHVSIRV